MDHIAVYGPDNDKRLTGKHETAPWNKFSYGVADRGASIRVPHSFVRNDYKGYLEDRRPNSQGDPYQIASQVLKTIAEVPTAGVEEGGRVKSLPHEAIEEGPAGNRRAFPLAAGLLRACAGVAIHRDFPVRLSRTGMRRRPAAS